LRLFCVDLRDSHKSFFYFPFLKIMVVNEYVPAIVVEINPTPSNKNILKILYIIIFLLFY